jgi:hypothetical protein
VSLLEHQLTDYAYKLIDGAVKQEYGNMIVNWEKHANNIITYAKWAFKNHELTLTRIKEEQRANHEFALLALSLVAGPAISFVAGALEHRVYAQLFGKQKATGSYVRVPTPTATVRVPVIDRRAHSETAAKVFGDFGGSLVQSLLVNPAIKAAAPSETALERQINLAADSTDLESFESSIKNTILEGKKLGETAIANYAGTILKDHEFGRKWLKKVQDAEPGYLILNDQAIRTMGEGMIRNEVDKQRRKWAKEWLYFGRNPRPITASYATNAIEVEIWRFWILRENFRFYGPVDDINQPGQPVMALGRSVIQIDEILTRLVELGVHGARSKAEKEKKVRRQLQADERNKDLGLLRVETAEVDGLVNTQAELAEILYWAAHRQPQLLGGHIPSIPRVSVYLPIDLTNVPTE